MKMKIDADEAVRLLLAQNAYTGTETVPLWELEGRVLADDICAVLPVPPFDRSPFDGYALIAADTADASRSTPAVFKITEEIPAGKAPEKPVTHGFAAKILTGAPLPEGADVTIKYEETEFSESEVKIFSPLKPGNVVRAGEDIQAGEKIAERGTAVSSALLGMLAGQGFTALRAYKKPVITVISTGSELRQLGEKLAPAQIYNSNVFTLSSYLRAVGVSPVDGGVVADEPEEIAKRISSALDVSDMVITTGGASVGDYDWAVRVSERMGADVLFWKVDFKPGGSMSAAMLGGKMILSLSGNPGAAVIGLLRIGMPYVKKLCGYREVFSECVTAVLKTGFKKASPQRRIVRGRLEITDGAAYFVPNDGQGNGVVSSLVGCDLLAEIPAGSEPVKAGEKIKAFRVPIR